MSYKRSLEHCSCSSTRAIIHGTHAWLPLQWSKVGEGVKTMGAEHKAPPRNMGQGCYFGRCQSERNNPERIHLFFEIKMLQLQQHAVRGKNMTHFLPYPPSTAILISTIDLPWHHLQWVITQPQSVKAVMLLPVCTHRHMLTHMDNHSLFLPTHARSLTDTHTHSPSCVNRHVRTHLNIRTQALVSVIALTRPNCLSFICMSMATHILHDSPFDKEGSFPQQRKWSPVDIVWLDFAFSRFQDHYRNSFEVLLKMKPRPSSRV